MVTLTEKAEQWPRRKNGEILFKTTHDAISYATLIADNKRMVDEIDHYRRSARREVITSRKIKDPNLNKLFEYAVKAQMFRECLDEVKRIREEL